MTRLPVRLRRLRPLLAGVALVLALAALPAAASAGPTYEARAGAVATQTFSHQGAGYPDRCHGWTQATGEVRVRVYSRGPFLLAHAGRFWAGGLSSEATRSVNITRDIDYRVHQADATSACQPCGPSSELGECGDAPPDVVGTKGCAPAATHDGFIATAFNQKGTLAVAGTADTTAVLRRCAPVPAGVPTGAIDLKLLKRTFPGAAHAIQALEPGQEKKFRKVSEQGDGSGKPCVKRTPKSPAFVSCTKHETVVVVRRVS